MNTFSELRDIFVTIPPGLYSWTMGNIDNEKKDCKIIIHLLEDKEQILIRQMFFHGQVKLQLTKNGKIAAGFYQIQDTKLTYKPWCDFDLSENLKTLEKYGEHRGKILYQLLAQLQIRDFI